MKRGPYGLIRVPLPLLQWLKCLATMHGCSMTRELTRIIEEAERAWRVSTLGKEAK